MTIPTAPRSTHWQIAPHGEADNLVQGTADIEQCLHTILGTRKGTDITRPAFGSNHFDWLDTPEDVFIPNCVREVALAIKTWEPRAVLEQVTIAGNATHIAMALHWRVADAVAGDVYRTDILLKAV